MYKFKLPNGVVHEEKLYNEVTLDELTGKQQNYLINTKYKSAIDHIEPLLLDLVMDLRDDRDESLFEKANKKKVILQRLPLNDIFFILAKLREITFGEIYHFDKLECPHCEHINHAELDLSKLEIKEGSKQDIDLILPKSKLPFKYKPLTYGSLKYYAGDSDRMLNSATTSTMSMVLASLGDNESPTEEDISNLKALDVEFIKNNAPEYNRLDIEITHSCKNCSKDYDGELEVMSYNFFVLTRI